jgi:hypothetical protein
MKNKVVIEHSMTSAVPSRNYSIIYDLSLFRLYTLFIKYNLNVKIIFLKLQIMHTVTDTKN